MVRMNSPEMEVVRFSEADIIVASTPTLTVSNLTDGIAKNAVFSTSGGYRFVNNGGTPRTDLYNALSTEFGESITWETRLRSSVTANGSNIATILNLDDGGTNKNYNGTYVWNSSVNGFVRN